MTECLQLHHFACDRVKSCVPVPFNVGSPLAVVIAHGPKAGSAKQGLHVIQAMTHVAADAAAYHVGWLFGVLFVRRGAQQVDELTKDRDERCDSTCG
jgi:hypothetical protein